ncbi:MAG: FhaA domain-containing protein [Desulfitobacteriaceae bacterium]
MSLLARFEEVAELLFTGPFRKTVTRLQPVEIAKELVKEMLKHKQVSISQVYVPNVYRVFLHSKDWGPLASFGETFLIELSKHLHSEGERNGYTFLSKPLIELHADDTVNSREMFIEVAFDDSLDIDWGEGEDNVREKELWREKINIFQDGVKTNFPEEGIASRNLRYVLEIIQGPDIGKLFPLNAENIYIGRHTQCELVLTDPEASRRHIKMTQCERGWLLDDLGSTNGTMVNGQIISRELISPGDRIQLGQTVMAIKRV